MARAKKKFHVHCILPNASTLINGIEFSEHEDGGMRTADAVDGEVASQFKGIPGYSIVPHGTAAVVSDQTVDADPGTEEADGSTDTPEQGSLLNPGE
jgi:hypothetical protein